MVVVKSKPCELFICLPLTNSLAGCCKFSYRADALRNLNGIIEVAPSTKDVEGAAEKSE